MSETTNSTETVSRAPWLKPHHFKKGQSGNPTGRPKKLPITDIYNELLEEGVTKSDIKKAMRSLVRGRSSATVQALKEMADRVEGKPTERHEITGAEGGPVRVKVEIVKRSA